MKIVMIIQKPQLRGAEVFASQLSSQLLAAGHKVKMVALADGTATLPFSGELIIMKRPLSKRLFDLSGWKQLATIINNFQPDIVQANAGDTLKFASMSKYFFRWKSVLVYRNANKVSDFVTSWPKRALNKFFVSNVQFVISVSELCRLDFTKTYSFDERKTVTIPIGIELSAVPTDIPSDLRHIFSGNNVVLNVASLVPEKNHVAVIRMAQQLLIENKDIKVVIVGDGRLRPILQQQIEALKLSDAVLLLGNRSDVLSIMANAKLLVLPSLIEGLPGVILEAFYCKLPVVANNVGGISEVVKPGVTGWLVNVNDESRLVSAVLEVMQKGRERLDEVKNNAFDLVVNNFSNEMIADRFLEVFRSVGSR